MRRRNLPSGSAIEFRAMNGTFLAKQIATPFFFSLAEATWKFGKCFERYLGAEEVEKCVSCKRRISAFRRL